jgi:hypothetical protein
LRKKRPRGCCEEEGKEERKRREKIKKRRPVKPVNADGPVKERLRAKPEEKERKKNWK